MKADKKYGPAIRVYLLVANDTVALPKKCTLIMIDSLVKPRNPPLNVHPSTNGDEGNLLK
jgi:hypothetical protein